MKPSYEIVTKGLIEKHLVPFFGDRDLREIEQPDLLRFIQVKLEAKLAPKTIRNALSVLRRVYNVLHADNKVERNPAARLGELMRRVDRRIATEVATIDTWTRDEIGALLATAQEGEPRFHPAPATLFYTGLRRGELLGLKWQDVDLDRGRIHVRRAIVRSQVTTPKSGKGRYVAIAPPLAELLVDVLAARRREGLARGWPEIPSWVFPDETGSFLNQDNFARTWRRVRRKAAQKGVRPLRLHCTRHTFASLALESGKSVRWVADQLGHADPAMTLRVYAHAIPDEETDLSFLDFGVAGRHYTAPDSAPTPTNENAPGLTDRGHSRILARPARLERATFRSAT